MEKQEIVNKVAEIAKQVFNFDGEITEQTLASEIKAWDSMNQIRFISELEGFFKVKFKMKDILTFNSIANVVVALERLL